VTSDGDRFISIPASALSLIPAAGPSSDANLRRKHFAATSLSASEKVFLTMAPGKQAEKAGRKWPFFGKERLILHGGEKAAFQ